MHEQSVSGTLRERHGESAFTVTVVETHTRSFRPRQQWKVVYNHAKYGNKLCRDQKGGTDRSRFVYAASDHDGMLAAQKQSGYAHFLMVGWPVTMRPRKRLGEARKFKRDSVAPRNKRARQSAGKLLFLARRRPLGQVV